MENVKEIKKSELTLKEMEELEKETQPIWEELLAEYCKPEKIKTEDGIHECQPCDLGLPCDMCHYDDDLQDRYKKALEKKLGIRLV